MKISKSIVAIVVLVAILVGANYFSGHLADKTRDEVVVPLPADHKPTLEELSSSPIPVTKNINFDRPGELAFIEQGNGALIINLAPGVENVLGFQGRIRAYHNYEEYEHLNGAGGGYVHVGDTDEYHEVTADESFASLASLNNSKNQYGYPVVRINSGDAGGASETYLIQLENALVVVVRSTDVSGYFGLPQDVTDAIIKKQEVQDRFLDNAFNRIIQSIRPKAIQ